MSGDFQQGTTCTKVFHNRNLTNLMKFDIFLNTKTPALNL